MKKSDILRNLNCIVEFHGADFTADYKLTAGIVRRKPNGEDSYSVELQDLRAQNSVLIAGLDQVTIKEGGESKCTI